MQMNNQQTEVEILLLIAEKAEVMRKNQKDYFRYRTINFLNNSKILESELDQLITKLKNLRTFVLVGEQQSLF